MLNTMFYFLFNRLCLAKGRFDKPFGGLHVLLAGDFYQMSTIQGKSLVESSDSVPAGSLAERGLKLFESSITHYIELDKNYRATIINYKTKKVSI